MSKIFLEILDKERQATLHKLTAFKKVGYLAGGTALALQINHRKSVDFDVFTSQPISNHFRQKVKKVFGDVEFYVNTGDQISFTTEKNIGVTFVWYYYKTLVPAISTSSLSLASVQDIAADKAHTIGRRAMWRDYVDFFWLLKNQVVTLPQIITLAEKKFAGEFVKTQFLEQLVYFKDVTISPIDFIDKVYSQAEIKSFLESQVEAYVKQIIPE